MRRSGSTFPYWAETTAALKSGPATRRFPPVNIRACTAQATAMSCSAVCRWNSMPAIRWRRWPRKPICVSSRFIDHFGYGNLLRVWHYFPHINDDENGLERYRGFNVGRHASFVANGRNIGEEDVPAASALGSNSGSLVIYFMASKTARQGRGESAPGQRLSIPADLRPEQPDFRARHVGDVGRPVLLLHFRHRQHRRLRNTTSRGMRRNRLPKRC